MPMEVHTQTPPQTNTTNGNTINSIPSYEVLWNKAISSSKPNLADLINFDWTQSEQTVNNFVDFLINLVTFKSTFAFECFSLLISAFEPYKIAIKNQTKVSYEKWELISMKVHFSFNKILSVIPLSSSILAKLIVNKFPHKSHPADVQHFYLKNALYVTRYCSSITQIIVSAAVSSMIQIDVSISIDEMPDDEDLQFDIEGNAGTNTAEEQEGKINAQKLDILMNLMLDYFDVRFGIAKKDSGNIFYFDGCEQQDLQSQDDLFGNMVKIFDQTVLPTYKSKYTQYLIFYICRNYHRNSHFPQLNTNTSLLSQFPSISANSHGSNNNNSNNNSNNMMSTSPVFITPSFNKLSNAQLSPNSFKKSPNNHNNSNHHGFNNVPSHGSPKKSFKNFLHIDPIQFSGEQSRVLYAESFIRYLFGKLCNDTIHSMHRHACAAYIGGFISRASFLPPHIIKLVFKDLLGFAMAYVERVDVKSNPNVYPDPHNHSLFYSVCQSIYYIFCFRNSVILDFSVDFKNDKKDEKQRDFWQDLHAAFRRISTSRLNPFKVCLKSVVRQFCSVCLRVGIFTKCTGILKSNKNVLLSKSTVSASSGAGNASTSGAGSNQFDSFFPFDPYLLFHSSKFFANSYMHWKDVRKDGDEENLEDLSDQDTDDEDEDDLLDKLSSESDSEFSDFEGSDSDDSDDDAKDSDDSDVEQLAEEFMSFTPEVRFDLRYHFKNRD